MSDAQEPRAESTKAVARRRSDGMPHVRHSGLGRAYFHDAYAWALRASWSVVLSLFAIVYVLINVIFAALFVAAGDVLVGARPGSFADAFYFSVQTLSTIGYGQFTPKGWGHALVLLESVTGVIVVALARYPSRSNRQHHARDFGRRAEPRRRASSTEAAIDVQLA
jgi:inward rectifier potassium channel